uniref:Uncharacterized protein n=1 Tax=Rhizophora mucronata TaxID=61149 RepID=A0A2P2J2C1_RHIMU
MFVSVMLSMCFVCAGLAVVNSLLCW